MLCQYFVYLGNENTARPLKQQGIGTRVTLGTRLIYSAMTMMSRAEIRCIMRNYYFSSVCVPVSGSGADSVLCSWFWGFVFPFRDLSFCFAIRVLGFRFCLYASQVLDFYFQLLSVCFVLRDQGKLSVFHILLFCFIFKFVILVFILCFRFGICVSVLGFGFHFWVLWSAFSLSTTIYIWQSYLCQSIYRRQLNSVKHLLTIQARKRLNYLGI